jgi:anti-sigma regulatory factor (Ser/Thr protein kinase)
MSVVTQDIKVGDGEHAVHFYERDSQLAGLVGAYLIDAADTGAAALVIATADHARLFEAELAAAGIDADSLRDRQQLVLLDAAATLAAFMPQDRIDGEIFREVIGTVVRRASEHGRAVRAYGEMVALLWDRGDVAAAIELETLWNDLQLELDFALLCAYRSESASEQGDLHAVAEVCRLHSKVLDTREFAPERYAPREARRFVSQVLRRHGHDGSILDDARLIVSELATNAVVHARSSFSVMLKTEGSRVRVSVADASKAEPRLREQNPRADRGHGLALIATVAKRWGIEATDAGKTVWAELPDRHREAARG